MSAELIGILTVGVALGGEVLALQSGTGKRLEGLASELSGLRGELRALGGRVARLERLVGRSGLFTPSQPTQATGDQPRSRSPGSAGSDRAQGPAV